MALIVRVTINDKTPVAILAAQRMTGTDDPDSVNHYEVGAWCVPLGEDRYVPLISEDASVTVEHRYGDGGLELVKKMVAVLP